MHVKACTLQLQQFLCMIPTACFPTTLQRLELQAEGFKSQPDVHLALLQAQTLSAIYTPGTSKYLRVCSAHPFSCPTCIQTKHTGKGFKQH